VEAMGIDIGGSGIKGAPVDLTSGELTGERYRIQTPTESTPEAIVHVVKQVIDFHGWHGPVGVTVPSVVIDGIVLTAANIDKRWIGFDAQTALEEELGEAVSVLNDADAAGLAEVRYGAARDRSGVCIVLTFGTGIGSAIINDGLLVPNSELGHLEFKGMEAEHYAAGRLVKRDERDDIGWWVERVDEFLQHIDLILSPRTIVFGGGISKRFDDFADGLHTRATVVRAQLLNNAGIVGAAMAASEGTHV
jgi:polyphosphate glucokinase